MFGLDENNRMRGELDRLNGLAQLGITVEIVGHELQDYDDIIVSGLRQLPPEVRDLRRRRTFNSRSRVLRINFVFYRP